MPEISKNAYYHVPVLSDAVIQYLHCQPGKRYVDCTLGGAGHSSQILEAIAPDGKLIAIDQDPSAIKNAQKQFTHKNTVLVHDNFKNIRKILDQAGINAVDGILADLGMSLFHIRQSGRGFSFLNNEPLDMRMNPMSPTTAEILINTLSEQELAAIFWKNGEERFSKHIARKIVQTRSQHPIKTTGELCSIVERVIPQKVKNRQKIHPATRVFMALRMAVNDELGSIQTFLENVLSCLNPGGRLCVISFHSLEDRLVKQTLRKWENPCTCPKDLPVCLCEKKSYGTSIVRKGITATPDEIQKNPMSRTARLRIFEKILQ
ncbi:MAG: 16S rRNA (cytosine(1402)-N(4))-methyltransferase RsmH [Candidatus Magnetomorum sp.]|nr:16S rRNA (cytosine(1402)-N(4))-methyltransferase RsmH [Candidatus Magnetomorum sp.]